MPHTNGDVFLTYKPMIIPLVSYYRTPSQQSSTVLWYCRINSDVVPQSIFIIASLCLHSAFLV